MLSALDEEGIPAALRVGKPLIIPHPPACFMPPVGDNHFRDLNLMRQGPPFFQRTGHHQGNRCGLHRVDVEEEVHRFQIRMNFPCPFQLEAFPWSVQYLPGPESVEIFIYKP